MFYIIILFMLYKLYTFWYLHTCTYVHCMCRLYVEYLWRIDVPIYFLYHNCDFWSSFASTVNALEDPFDWDQSNKQKREGEASVHQVIFLPSQQLIDIVVIELAIHAVESFVVLVCCTMFLCFRVRIILPNLTSVSPCRVARRWSVVYAKAEFYQQRLRSLQGLRVPLAAALLVPMAIALRL